MDDSINYVWTLSIDGGYVLVSIDSSHKRLHISSFVVEKETVTKDDMLKMLKSHGFNSCDVRYAIYDNAVWVVFDHPLKRMSKSFFIEAINR